MIVFNITKKSRIVVDKEWCDIKSPENNIINEVSDSLTLCQSSWCSQALQACGQHISVHKGQMLLTPRCKQTECWLVGRSVSRN